MKRLVFLVLIVAAVWYGWPRRGEILGFLQKKAGHEAVIENRTGLEMIRVRLTVDGKTYVQESIADGGRAAIPFRVDNDAGFALVWQYGDRMGEHSWTGGMVPRGPMTQRHIMTVDGENNVLYRAENK